MAAKKKVLNGGKVAITLPRAHFGEEDFLFVGLNGVGYQIPRGKEVYVPEEVAEEIYRSVDAEERMYEDRERRLAESNTPINR